MTVNNVASRAMATFTTVSVALLTSSCATSAQVENGSQANTFGTAGSVVKPLVPVKKYVRPKLSPDRPLLIVYPSPAANVPSSGSFIIGSTYPGYTLTVNGQNVLINKEGFFAHVIALNRGKNQFDLRVSNAEGNQIYSQSLDVQREQARQSLPATSFEFAKDSFEPKDDRGVNVGEIIEFAVRATPGCQAQVILGKKHIALSPINNLRVAHSAMGRRKSSATKLPGSAINRGMEAAYGQMFQRHSNAADLYVGLYRVEAGDNFEQEHPRFLLQKAGQSITTAGAAAITVLRQPQIARTAHDETITRVAPDLARLTPLPQGVRLLVDGYQGENIRCRYTPSKHIWIKREDLDFEETGSPAPEAVARTIIVKQDNYGESLVIPLSQRLPFIIEQNLKTNHLMVKIFGVSADTDWVYQAPDDSGNSHLIENVSWKQPEDHVYQIDVDLKGLRQWGYFADFDDNNLNIHIKNAPKIDLPIATSAGPAAEEAEVASLSRLKGLTVCIDPGHGGKETGAIGPSAIREAEINLAIALKLRDLLKADGATVFMTREDDTDVSLNDRVDFAKAKKVDLLISVHNNALPDGRDPVKEHGTSTYWYHPQSQELARALKNGAAKELGFPDIGARYQNLALCRPTNMQAVLVEVGFVSNPDEYARLINPTWQTKAAQGILNGLHYYFGRN